MLWTEIVTLLVLGLAAGALGGLLGIGGSIVMIPVLTLVLGRNQHLSQASAMIVNVFVSAPAVLQHHRAGAINWTIAARMLPAGLICIILGVEASNIVKASMLEKVFGVFLIYVAAVNIPKLFEGREPTTDGREDLHGGWLLPSVAGALMGLIAGLLGVGGGIVAVPVLQRICRLPLRCCIAVSATTMCVTAPLGAVRKNMALSRILPEAAEIVQPVTDSLMIAGYLIPTAILGALLGARLTHTLPLKWVRLAFILLLSIASAKYLIPV